MSEQSIYNALRAGGLSPTSASSMMGNMYCESALRSNNVEDRCTLGDVDYTLAVDTGTISRYQFKVDAYGYGLCQWTYPSRKAELYDLAKNRNVSIADETMQCDFCLIELHRDYTKLFDYLCTTDDLPEATKRICAEYERPAVNNFADRINIAQRFYNQFGLDDVGCSNDVCPIEFDEEEMCEPKVRVLHKGCLGRDVFLLQCALFDMGIDCGIPDGDYGKNTFNAVRILQSKYNIDVTGVVDKDEWEIILSSR